MLICEQCLVSLSPLASDDSVLVAVAILKIDMGCHIAVVDHAYVLLDGPVRHVHLQKFTDSMAKYIQYQADSGAQAVQIFDSWATEQSPLDFEEFSPPYLKQIVDSVKKTHPDLPIILYNYPLCTIANVVFECSSGNLEVLTSQNSSAK
ncbi:hypothetical protein IFM89_016317, partial [Coptis chinensis]